VDTAYGRSVLLNLTVVNHAHTRVLYTSLMMFNVVGLQQNHVAAFAAAALQKTACGGTRVLGCNNLQQLITDGIKTVPQSKMGKAWIAITDL
jgi:hypothetical protein